MTNSGQVRVLMSCAVDDAEQVSKVLAITESALAEALHGETYRIEVTHSMTSTGEDCPLLEIELPMAHVALALRAADLAKKRMRTEH